MRRLVAAAALIVPLLVLAPATGAAPLCGGEPATIVGERGGTVRGTEGRDVVVTRGADRVLTFGGDDRVCVTGNAYSVRIDTGDGDDVVDARGTGRNSQVDAELGAGDDVYRGGDGYDFVDLKGGDDPGSGRDIVSTGGNSDEVRTGAPGERNDDVVRAGPGGDTVYLAGSAGSRVIVDGGGVSARFEQDDLQLRIDPGSKGDRVLDSRRRSARVDGERWLSWRRFDSFRVVGDATTRGSLTFRGSGRDESLTVDSRLAIPLTLRMGGGDDYLRPEATYSPSQVYDGGPGRDELGANVLVEGQPIRAFVTVDLPAGRVDFGAPGGRAEARIAGFEDVYAAGDHVAITGSAAANRLVVEACVTRVQGGSGDDVIGYAAGTEINLSFRCTRGGPGISRAFLGGPGDDRLRGSQEQDRLFGEAGNDLAIGRRGVDVCVAERTESCER